MNEASHLLFSLLCVLWKKLRAFPGNEVQVDLSNRVIELFKRALLLQSCPLGSDAKVQEMLHQGIEAPENVSWAAVADDKGAPFGAGVRAERADCHIDSPQIFTEDGNVRPRGPELRSLTSMTSSLYFTPSGNRRAMALVVCLWRCRFTSMIALAFGRTGAVSLSTFIVPFLFDALVP